MKLSTRGSVIVAVAILVALLAPITCFDLLLWQPSQVGKCGGATLGHPVPIPHIARFRGEVVGKNLWFFQYRWIRRRFKAVGTTLSLIRELPSYQYKGNTIPRGESAGEVVIGKSGRFDFGDLPPGMYDLTVAMPGEDADGFGFVIDPSAHNTDVLIDDSPAYYCNCCGWDFEVR
jgi:hypothetical protein